MIALEDIAPHIQTPYAAGNRSVSQRKSFVLRQLLATCYNNRHRTGCYNFFRIITIIRFDDVDAHFGDDTGYQLKKIAVRSMSFPIAATPIVGIL